MKGYKVKGYRMSPAKRKARQNSYRHCRAAGMSHTAAVKQSIKDTINMY